MAKNALWLPLASVLLLLLFGCTYVGNPYGGGINASDLLNTTQSSLPAYNSGSDMICNELNDTQPCYLMVCQNSTYWLADLLGLNSWFDTTLEDGECRFDKVNLTEYQELANDSADNSTIRVFMMGFGPSFTSTDKANTYCNYSLQLATKWMKGGAGAPPPVPDTRRAICWLQRNTLPVYMYYTGGQDIDPAQTLKIAEAFDGNDTGPALLTTEINLDSSKPADVQAVREQIRALDECDGCLTVLAVRAGDESALQQILGSPPSYYSDLYDKVDVVGFGFLANDYPTCNLDEIIGQNYRFSRLILQNYSKPSIWLYAGISEGNNSNGICRFGPEQVHDFYKNIYALTPSFPSAGIIGVSFYEASDNSGPLNCTIGAGCQYGIFYANGSQKHPEINSWASYCNPFASQSFRSPLLFSRNGRGAVCDTLASDEIMSSIENAVNSPRVLSYGNLTPQVSPDPNLDFSCGEICPSESEMPRPEIYDNLAKTFASGHCQLYPQIEELADDNDVSAIYMRAIFEEESAFDPFAVSCSKTSNCANPSHLNASKICEMAGHASNCAHVPGAYWGDSAVHSECPSGWWPCAFGISQCISLPGDSAYNTKCGGSDSTYDPFDPAEGACCGTKLFSQNLIDARSFINTNWAELADEGDGGPCDGGITSEERPWAEYFLASTYYGIGAGQPLLAISKFTAQRDNVSTGGDCTGKANYAEYLRNITATASIDYGYAAVPMSTYISAVDVCGSDCPGKK
ncbi:Uncharacterised protein [uncultured archaeon]|nr:Uncharacterised protein [uncultured archaeon]